MSEFKNNDASPCFYAKNMVFGVSIRVVNAKNGNHLGVIQRKFVYLQAETNTKIINNLK